MFKLILIVMISYASLFATVVFKPISKAPVIVEYNDEYVSFHGYLFPNTEEGDIEVLIEYGEVKSNSKVYGESIIANYDRKSFSNIRVTYYRVSEESLLELKGIYKDVHVVDKYKYMYRDLNHIVDDEFLYNVEEIFKDKVLPRLLPRILDKLKIKE